MESSDAAEDSSTLKPAGEETDGSADRPRRSRRVAANISALLTSVVTTRATRFVIYAMIGRTLGASDLGRIAIAVALLQLIGRISLVGLPTLAAREVAADRSTAGAFLVNGGLTIALTATAAYGVLFVVIAAIGYESATADVIWVLFIGLIPFGLSQMTEAVLVGLERANFVALVNVPVNLSQTLIVVVLLRSGYGVKAIALSLALEFVAIAALQTVMIATRVRPGSGRIDLKFARSSVRAALPFLGMASTGVMRGTAGALIISAVVNEAAVGIYAAANQLQIPLRLTGQAIGTAVLPTMVRAWKRGVGALESTTGRMLELIIMAVLPAAVGLVLIAPDAFRLVYDSDEFSEGVIVLRILAAGAVAMAIASILGRALVAAGRELVTMRISIVNTTTFVGMSLLLTSAFGIVGAAAAAAVAAFLNFAQHIGSVKKLLGTVPVASSVWRPIAATGLMTVVVVITSGLPVLASVGVGVVSYSAALAGTFLWPSRR